MGKYIIIIDANPMGYAVDTTLMATNKLADKLIDAGHAKAIDEPVRPKKDEDSGMVPQINVTVPTHDHKPKRKAGRPPKTVPIGHPKLRKTKF